MKAAFRTHIIIRLLLIFGLGIGAFLVFSLTSFWLLGGWLLLFSLVAIMELVRFVERDRRSLLNFLIAVNQNDFMGNVGISKDQKFLYRAYQSLSSKYHQIATEKQANHLFLNTIVENAGVPMIAYEEEKQEVVLINEGAKGLFKKPYFRSLNSLNTIDQELVETIRKLKNNEKKLYRFQHEGSWQELSIVATRLQLQGKWFKLIALHNIKNELDEKELESWQKLIRVLTHEIKNSVIPISTMTEVINQTLESDSGNEVPLSELSLEDEEDLRIGLRTISKRSKGLVSFVNAYGDMAKVPVPKLEMTNLNEMIQGVVQLENRPFQDKKAVLKADIPKEPVEAMVDGDLLAQVLINLVKNALEAIGPKGVVTIDLKKSNQEFTIQVTDNGPGITPDVLENIFVPFFTTKKEGSGIGLSLSRQIVRKHHGDLTVTTAIGTGTTFAVAIPQ